VHGGTSSRTNKGWVREHVVGDTNDFFNNDSINSGHSTTLVSDVPASRASIMTTWRDVLQIDAGVAIVASSGGLHSSNADTTNGWPDVKHPPSLQRQPPTAAAWRRGFRGNAYGQRCRWPSAASRSDLHRNSPFSQPKPNQPAEIRAADGGNFSSATVKIDRT
jgi:hypothetical protein